MDITLTIQTESTPDNFIEAGDIVFVELYTGQASSNAKQALLHVTNVPAHFASNLEEAKQALEQMLYAVVDGELVAYRHFKYYVTDNATLFADRVETIKFQDFLDRFQTKAVP